MGNNALFIKYIINNALQDQYVVNTGNKKTTKYRFFKIGYKQILIFGIIN